MFIVEVMGADQLLNQQLSCLCPLSLSCLTSWWVVQGVVVVERLRRVAELQLLGSDNDSSKLLVVVVVEGHSSHMLPSPVPAHNCVASTGAHTADSLALAPHWHHQHTGHTGCSQLTATSQHLQHHTGEAEAGLHLASTGDTGDTGARRRERCPGGSPGTAGAGRVVVAVCWLSAMVLQPSFVINKLTPLQLQHLGPATRLVTLLTLALQP